MRASCTLAVAMAVAEAGSAAGSAAQTSGPFRRLCRQWRRCGLTRCRRGVPRRRCRSRASPWYRWGGPRVAPRMVFCPTRLGRSAIGRLPVPTGTLEWTGIRLRGPTKCAPRRSPSAPMTPSRCRATNMAACGCPRRQSCGMAPTHALMVGRQRRRRRRRRGGGMPQPAGLWWLALLPRRVVS